jgi:DNA-directed RNA polymerase specialized sigma24 family protein
MSSSDVFWIALKEGLLRENPIRKVHQRLNRQERELSKLQASLANAPHTCEPLRRKRAKILSQHQIKKILSLARTQITRIDLSLLTEKQEECFLLCDFCHFPVAMVARSLGIHRTTVDERLNRAMTRLRRESYKEGSMKKRAETKPGLEF